MAQGPHPVRLPARGRPCLREGSEVGGDFATGASRSCEMADPEQNQLCVLSTYKSTPNVRINSKVYDKQGRPTPGPNKYDLVDTDKFKFSRMRTVKIAAYGREDGRVIGESPGPGAYAPEKSGSLSTRSCSFGAAPRLEKPARGKGPGPGQYEVRRPIGGPRISVSGAVRSTSMSDLPGPGAYEPGWSQIEGSSKAPAISAGSRPKVRVAKGPGPGQYKLPSTLGGNFSSSEPFVPSYSFTNAPTTKSMRRDETPGPMKAPTQFPPED